MIVKTFTGPSVRETLQMVRDAFGADAVILETRMDEGGPRQLGISRGGVVITAAAEPQRPPQPAADGPRSLYLKGSLGDSPAPIATAAPAIEIDPPQIVEEAIPAATRPAPAPMPQQFDAVLSELQAISRAFHSSSANGNGNGNEALWDTMRHWLSGQPSLAAGIIETFVTHLIDSLPPYSSFLNAPSRSQSVLVVGARGAGKSTFAFKALAARWQEIQRKPSLVILSVSPEHGHERMHALSIGCGVDCSAFALGQTRRIRLDSDSSDNVIAEYVGGRVNDDCEAHARLIRRGLKPDVVVLVLNATVAPSIWRQQLNRFAILAPTHLAFTHWDEAQPWWDAIMFSGQSRLPLAYRVSGFEAFGEIDAFTPSELQAGISDYVTHSLGSSDGDTVRKEGK